jgi:hypothetical protein
MALFWSILWHGFPNGLTQHSLGACLGWKHTLIHYQNASARMFEIVSNFGEAFVEVAGGVCSLFQSSLNHFRGDQVWLGCCWMINSSHYQDEYWIKAQIEYWSQHYVAASAFFWIHLLHWVYRYIVEEMMIKGTLLVIGFVLETVLLLTVLVCGSMIYAALAVGLFFAHIVLFFGGYWAMTFGLSLLLSVSSYVMAPFLCLTTLFCRSRAQVENGLDTVV